jgi:SAM-dependent methyltransferase
MDWHARYRQQAQWTRELRAYLFEKTGLAGARQVLEVGCGTGAILQTLDCPAAIHGLDHDPAALRACTAHAPGASLTRGDALALPYATGTFDITYCHFLLLWVGDPLRGLQEMKRVTRRGGNILALAEPDYGSRMDEPDELAALGRWQTEALRRQGADPSLGERLAELFSQAGLEILERGMIHTEEQPASREARSLEWEVIRSDLEGMVSPADLDRMHRLDEAAYASGERILHVPTYFCWGRG